MVSCRRQVPRCWYVHCPFCGQSPTSQVSATHAKRPHGGGASGLGLPCSFLVARSARGTRDGGIALACLVPAPAKHSEQVPHLYGVVRTSADNTVIPSSMAVLVAQDYWCSNTCRVLEAIYPGLGRQQSTGTEHTSCHCSLRLGFRAALLPAHRRHTAPAC